MGLRRRIEERKGPWELAKLHMRAVASVMAGRQSSVMPTGGRNENAIDDG